jgi:hypothetical protein
MNLKKFQFREILENFRELKTINNNEIREVLGFFDEDFPFYQALGIADSLHVHIKVKAVDELPQQPILALGAHPENEKDGYVKYSFPCGLNMIFSSINVSQDDLLLSCSPTSHPFVDHIGIDLRQETNAVLQLFSEIPTLGTSQGWRHVQQGCEAKPVYCCHVEVAKKHWLYPPRDSKWTRPIEFAYGKLKVNASSMGCDLRPLDPDHPMASELIVCQ